MMPRVRFKIHAMHMKSLPESDDAIPSAAEAWVNADRLHTKD